MKHFHQVDAALWRSSQPSSAEDWKLILATGIERVIKLNFRSEADDRPPFGSRLQILYFPLEPEGGSGLEALAHAFRSPKESHLRLIDRYLNAATMRTLVHCTHGQDRTGLVVARHRVLVHHWSCHRAFQEALQHGFHPVLTGLVKSWVEFCAKR